MGRTTRALLASALLLLGFALSACGHTDGPWPDFIDEPAGFTAQAVPGVSPPYCGLTLVPKRGTRDVHARLLRWVKDNATFLRVDPKGAIIAYIPQNGSDNVPVVVSFGPPISVSFCSG